MAKLSIVRKIKGSTLIETLVAMTVILISLVFCGIIFFNVLNSGNNYAKFRAHSLIYEAALKTKTDKRFIDEKIEDDGILIQKTMSSYNGIKDLHLEIFTASDANGKLLDEYKEIIFLPGQ